MEGPDDGDKVVRANIKGAKRIQETAGPIHGPNLLGDLRVIEIPMQEATARVPMDGVGQATVQRIEHVIAVGEAFGARTGDRAIRRVSRSRRRAGTHSWSTRRSRVTA